MSWQATAWVIEHSKHKGSALLTLLCIANCSNEDGTDCWPNKARLARDTRMSPRQLDRVVNKLESSGELAVQRSSGRHPNHYSFPLMKPNPVILPGFKPELTPSPASGFNPVISDPNPVIAMAHDPSVERSRKIHQELMAFLFDREGPISDGAAQAAAIKWLLKTYSAEQCKTCFAFLAEQSWRTARVSWLTVRKEIGAWVNGNLRPAYRSQAELNRGGRGNGVVI